MQIWLSSLELVKGDVSTLIHQMELTYVSYFETNYIDQYEWIIEDVQVLFIHNSRTSVK